MRVPAGESNDTSDADPSLSPGGLESRSISASRLESIFSADPHRTQGKGLAKRQSSARERESKQKGKRFPSWCVAGEVRVARAKCTSVHRLQKNKKNGGIPTLMKSIFDPPCPGGARVLDKHPAGLILRGAPCPSFRWSSSAMRRPTGLHRTARSFVR